MQNSDPKFVMRYYKQFDQLTLARRHEPLSIFLILTTELIAGKLRAENTRLKYRLNILKKAVAKVEAYPHKKCSNTFLIFLISIIIFHNKDLSHSLEYLISNFVGTGTYHTSCEFVSDQRNGWFMFRWEAVVSYLVPVPTCQ